MPAQYKRREFIRNVSLCGLSLEMMPSVTIGDLIFKNEPVILKNDLFSISFGESTGRVNVTRNQGNILLKGATSRVNLKQRKKSISDPVYEHKVDVHKVTDRIGTGKQAIIRSIDKDNEINFQVSYSLYDNLSCIVIEVVCENVSGRTINIRSIEPVCAIEETGSYLSWTPSSKAITNGPMYYDAGMVYNFGENYQEPSPYGPIKGSTPSPEFKYPAGHRVRSWWNIGLFGGYDKEGLVCGFAENKTGLGQIILSKDNSGDLSLYTESVFSEGTELNPGQAISSGKFVISISDDPYKALEDFAGLMGKLNSARTGSIVNGWCSWFYTYDLITEEEVIRNSEFISGNLKKFGLKYVQIDEGYQRFHGDWEGNKRFPHGMKWLAARIKDYGLKPGLWVAPFVISEPTEVFAKHPEWLLKNGDGQLRRVGPWPDEASDWAKNENPKRYGLDISHPGAQKWLFNLFDTIGNDWGYEMVKIDFVAWSLLSADHYYDAKYTTASAYRKGIQVIRDALGNEKHINDCGPGPVTVGLIDSMRIEIDQNYGFSSAAWKQYFLDSSSSAPAMAKRYYFNNRTWTNDADHVCINLLSIPQAKAAATLIALSGGNIISGDRLTDLDNPRLEILKKIYPSFGEAAKPVDLFDTDRHSIFSLTIKKSFGEWTIVGFFNASLTEVITKTLPIERLWLDPEKTYIIYDFWMERLVGETSTGDLEVKVLPENVTLLALHEKKEIPQVISTNRHVLQGAIETDDIHWDEITKTLYGVSTGPIHTSYNVLVYIPNGVTWKQDRQSLYKDFENYSIKLIDEQMLRVHLNFAETETIEWNICFSDIL